MNELERNSISSEPETQARTSTRPRLRFGFKKQVTELCLILAVAALQFGCGGNKGGLSKTVSESPEVHVTSPTTRTISRDIGQPSFVEAYEQTAIYAKLPGYLEKWYVDIGDRVEKDQVLATLFIPELVQEHEQKKAIVKEDDVRVEQAKKLVAVADANLKSANFQVKQAQANVGQAQALVERWTSEVDRLNVMVRENVVDKQVLTESQRQLASNQAGLLSAKAAVDTATANELAAQANLEKARVDVQVALARAEVSLAERERLKALTGYLTLKAPYKGIITARNANVGDFVLPATGDPSAAQRSGDQSSTKASPIYVVARIDLVRVYVDVAEGDSINIVTKVNKTNGDSRPVTQGTVRIFSLNNVEIPAEATRSSWALNFRSRTLRTEIDLPNDGKLLPGMYAYGKLQVVKPDAKALPLSAVIELGNQFGCYLAVGGKAVWTPVETGINDGTWIEIFQKLAGGKWIPFDGTEQVITDQLDELSNGREIRVVK